MKPKTTRVIGASYALIAVALGAFGAHALKPRLTDLGSLSTWETAVDYQMWHALALLILASRPLKGKAGHSANICLTIGIALFSGSLYWLALDGPRWLGPLTPLGGLLLLVAWACLICAALRMKNE